MRKNLIAIATGFISGALLNFLWAHTVNSVSQWWYQAALVLTGIVLGWLFCERWLLVTLSIGLAPVLIDVEKIWGVRAIELWPIQMAYDFAVGFPAALVGGGIGRALSKTRASRSLWVVFFAAAIGTGIVLPLIADAQFQHIESIKVPDILEQLHAAEISYGKRQPDGAFTCDARQLPKVQHVYEPWQPAQNDLSTFNQFMSYTIYLECPPEPRPHDFCIWAFSDFQYWPGPTYWIDESGRLEKVRARAGDYLESRKRVSCSVVLKSPHHVGLFE